MGNLITRIKRENEDIGSTPKTKIENDPRSPSANIVRTPIQIGTKLQTKETPIVGVINTTFDETTENSSVNIDPRSPAVEFTRTPIIITQKEPKIKNKNLDIVRQQLRNDFSPIKTTKNETVCSNNIQGPVLLEVSPITKRTEQIEKRKSYVGLLETNLDFIETDIDKVSRSLNNSKNIVAEKDEIDIEINKVSSETDNLHENSSFVNDEINTENDVNAVGLNIEISGKNCKIENEEIGKQNDTENKVDEVFNNACATENKDHEQISTSVTENKDQEQISTSVTEKETKVGKSKIISPKISKICKTSPINETLKKISLIDKEVKDIIAYNPITELEDLATTKDFDRKISSLIYEDVLLESIPKTVQIKSENRTALSERNINQNERKIRKLKVSDKPMNISSSYVTSKIPVSRDKKSKIKVAQQCENTPPRQRNPNQKDKKSQWDADSTLII